MRILRFFSDDGSVHLGVRDGGQIIDLGACSPISLMDGKPPSGGPRIPYAGLRLDAPIRDCPKLLALAGNYREHVREAGMEDLAPSANITPQVFWKPPTTAINRPGGVVPIRPNNVFVDWEIELAVVIGRRTKNVQAEAAMESVFGYTILNDISERKFNASMEGRHLRQFDPFFDWLMGKWFDGHAPLGPEIVTVDEVPDPHNLGIRLSVNGELMQDSNTRHMIFSIPETIAYIASVLTLEPGDIIATGTPHGVGSARGIFLKPGDVIRGEIEGLGILENVIALEES
ncbi:MAG: fumarylacetoacetate hydrolase family protein [Bryobacteraceae bacterium]|nr:fumarylacetoacetate hydrolase family protein [Bryobacterales bacterium]MEB2360762.1 fumarylacetoacetate hydrolase family protein [Bryobacterales bacterium]NUN01055.1 fumarylacetoacetate hydrolase family protein [Bryobacteraceae bacterium]